MMNLEANLNQAIESWQRQVMEQAVSEQSLAVQEAAAQQSGLRLAQIALQALVTAQGKGYQGTQVPCECDEGVLRYQRDGVRRVRTLVGEIEYVRACYYCRHCRASRCPLDEQLGQSPRHVSAGVERGLSLLSAHLSFATAAQVMGEIGHVAVRGRQVEAISEAVGEQAIVTEAAHIAAVAQAELAPLAVGGRERARPRTWIVEMDGVQVGLQDGSWQEVKCGIIYQSAERVEISAGRWELVRRARCVGRESAPEFRRRLWALLHRVGVCDGDAIVVVADGAEWIDHTVEELFVGATRIMDFYHAAQRIWAVAAVRFGAATAAAKQWAGEKLHALKAGEVREVVGAFKRLKLQEAEARGVRQASVSYLEGHQAGMP